MKRLAGIIAVIVFLAPVCEVLAGGVSWRRSQARARKALKKWHQEQDEAWDKHEAEIEKLKKQAGSAFKKNPQKDGDGSQDP